MTTKNLNMVLLIFVLIYVTAASLPHSEPKFTEESNALPPVKTKTTTTPPIDNDPPNDLLNVFLPNITTKEPSEEINTSDVSDTDSPPYDDIGSPAASHSNETIVTEDYDDDATFNFFDEDVTNSTEASAINITDFFSIDNENKNFSIVIANPLPTLPTNTPTFEVVSVNAEDGQEVVPNSEDGAPSAKSRAKMSKKKKGSGGFSILLVLLILLLILLLAFCLLCFLFVCRRNASTKQNSDNAQHKHKSSEPAPLITPVKQPDAEDIEAIEFKHVGPIKLQTMEQSISMVHELDGDKAPVQSDTDHLVIDPAQNEVYEIGSDVELRMNGNEQLKQQPAAVNNDNAVVRE